MPVIKIYGFHCQDPKAVTVRDKIEQAMAKIFGPDDAGTVMIPSVCRTCGAKEQYQYLEVLYRSPKDFKKIIKALKKIKIGLDIISFQLLPNGFIPEDQMR